MALTGTGNHFAFSQAGGQFEAEFAAGFTGQFDPITVRRAPHEFQIDGGDGAGASSGADAAALINGVELSSTNNQFTFQGEHGTYQIEFAAGFSGAFDPITARSTLETLHTDGGVDGLVYGNDSAATINGQELAGSGNQFEFVEDDRRVTLVFQAGFEGQFDTIAAINRSRKLTQQVRKPAPPQPAELPSDDAAGDPSAARPNPLDLLLDELDRLLSVPDEEPPTAIGPRRHQPIACRPGNSSTSNLPNSTKVAHWPPLRPSMRASLPAWCSFATWSI